MAKKTTRKKVTKKKVTKKKGEPLYVGVVEPETLRKDILESVRELIQFLQSYEQFKKLKDEKNRTLAILKSDVKDIKSEVEKLKMYLKKRAASLPAPAPIKKSIPKEIEPQKDSFEEVRTSPVSRRSNELAALEQELGEIEKKLGTLG